MTLLKSFSIIRVLRQRHLAILWSSQLLSAIGDHLYEVAVVWLSVRIAGSGGGLVLSAGALSRLIFGLLGGVYADRWDRRRIMIATDLSRALAVLTLPFAALIDEIHIWHLTIVAAILGSLSVLFEPALQASLPVMSGDMRTLQALNGLMDVTRRLARILGPGLAGVLIAVMPISQLFSVDALSFGISACALFTLGRAYAQQAITNVPYSKGITGVLADITEAIRVTRNHRSLFWSLVGIGLINLTWSAAFIVGVALFANKALEADIGDYGLIVGAYGIGNVVSNLVVSSLVIKRRALTFFLGQIVLGGGFLLLAYASNLSIALIAAAIAAVGGPMGDIPLLMTIQNDFLPNQIGKIYSLRMTIASVGASLGFMLAVPLFRHFSPSSGIALCAFLMVSIGVIGTIRFGEIQATNSREQLSKSV